MPTRPSFRFRPRVVAVPGAPTCAELLPRLAGRPGLALLDSAGGRPARHSLVAFDPLRRVADVDAREGDACGAALGAVRDLLGELDAGAAERVPGPFQGGFVGALAYDLGVAGAPRPAGARPEPWGLPLVAGGLYTDFVVRDEHERRTWLVLGEDPGDDRPPLPERRARLLDELAAPAPARPAPARPAPARPAPARGPLVRCTPPAEHRRRVDAVRELIGAGDVYQVNLAHRFLRDVRAHPLELYARLRAVNPAPYMGYLALEDETGSALGALLSASPELLVEVEGRRARTRPIKGTAPRGATPEQDRERREALLASAKDRAELVMIVDLERNDLGRVARPGGVRVEGLPTLESYASVHHLVADVVAELREGVDALDVVAALFPGGSITGAPKRTAMDAIAELEGEGRGFFTGSLGFVDARGNAALDILIRTILWRPLRPGPLPPAGRDVEGQASFRVGGGITWSSDPAEEDRETLAKAAALAAALAEPGADPWESAARASAPPAEAPR